MSFVSPEMVSTELPAAFAGLVKHLDNCPASTSPSDEGGTQLTALIRLSASYSSYKKPRRQPQKDEIFLFSFQIKSKYQEISNTIKVELLSLYEGCFILELIFFPLRQSQSIHEQVLKHL